MGYNSSVQSIFVNKGHSLPKLEMRRDRERMLCDILKGTKPGADPLAADQRLTGFKG